MEWNGMKRNNKVHAPLSLALRNKVKSTRSWAEWERSDGAEMGKRERRKRGRVKKTKIETAHFFFDHLLRLRILKLRFVAIDLLIQKRFPR